MKRLIKSVRVILLLSAFSMTITGCTIEPESSSLDETQKFTDNSELSARKNPQFQFNTTLSGKNEIPEKDTKAVGEAIIKISKDESWIKFKLIVANIQNVTGSHLHMATPDANGGVVVPLYSNGNQPAGPSNGVLAEGIITAQNVVGALAGDLNALIDAIRSGNIYVNVHTTKNPSGEIRGQL